MLWLHRLVLKLCWLGRHDWATKGYRRCCRDCGRTEVKVRVAINEMRWVKETES